MDNKVLTVAIIGAGSRGADSYGMIILKDPRFKIVAVCDVRQVRLNTCKERFGVEDKNLFLDENEFFKEKRADICVVANALILKAAFYENEISVDSHCCAGVTPKTHNSAIDTMKMCQIIIK